MGYNKVLLAALAVAISVFAYSQDVPARQGLDDDALKKANNPMAKVKAFNVHNYLVSSMYGIEDNTINQLIARYAQPLGNFLLRVSIPFVTSSVPDKSPTTGFGDFNAFAIYSFPTSSAHQLGIGPSVTAPTGTHNLGTGKWQAGVSILAFFSASHVIQVGSLLQWQASFAGDDSRADVNQLAPQLFFIWQIGGGAYLRSTGVLTFDLTNGHYNVPLGLGIGKVIKAGSVIFNVFAEPQISVLAGGIGQPKFQTFIGFNTQF